MEDAVEIQTDTCYEPSEDDLKNGARDFELFFLRPQRFADKIVPVRLKIERNFGGWKLKDGLIKALGMTIGDTISTEVSVLLGPGIIDEKADTDLFAEGLAADWLLDTVLDAGTAEGCTIDCFVRLKYCKAPVGGVSGAMIYKASLILEKGVRFVGVEETDQMMKSLSHDTVEEMFSSLFSD